MTNFERNIRTLLVCFVIALGVLVPLRFMEINNQRQQLESVPQVLGVHCWSEQEVNRAIEEINQKVTEEDLTNDEIIELAKMVDDIKDNKCF